MDLARSRGDGGAVVVVVAVVVVLLVLGSVAGGIMEVALRRLWR